MRKKVLFLSIICILFLTLNYTYSAFRSNIVGTINANVKDWVFKVSVDNGTIYNDDYKLHLSGTSGSFNVNINTTNGTKNANYTIELIDDSSIKFYTDSSYTKLISNNIYSGSINSNTSSSVTIYYKSDTAINSDILIKTKGTIMETAMMKNGNNNLNNNRLYFWKDSYSPYIRTITFDNNLSNKPESCTGDSDLCWDISYSSSQNKKVYAYLTDSGLKDSTDTTKSLYNLYIVSEAPIFAPENCSMLFSFGVTIAESSIRNIVSINFNNNFNTSEVADMRSMFYGCKSLTNLDISNFNTANVTSMDSMFSGCSSLTNLDLSNFNTANVTSMDRMFYNCSSLTNLDLSNFNTANVKSMYGMFSGCSSLTNLDLSNFNTSNVTSMGAMFSGCSSLTNLDLSNFNTSNVTYMGGMFRSCSSLINLDLSRFNTSQVTNMDDMFQLCSSLKSLDLSNFSTLNVTSMNEMFQYCSSLTTTINIINSNGIRYFDMFDGAATNSGSKITVNYIADTSTLVDNMIATKSDNSNVVKGSIIIIPEYSITISGNDDIKYESNSRANGVKVTLTSISGNNYVTSFKMNGTTINGNKFIMPDGDVTITDIVTVECKTIETDHNPYLNSQNNVVLGEYTFEGAKSLTVILDYQTENTAYDYFYIYDSSTSTTAINNNKKYGDIQRTTETITINSAYIKITFKSDNSGNEYYGLKAIVIPNY